MRALSLLVLFLQVIIFVATPQQPAVAVSVKNETKPQPEYLFENGFVSDKSIKEKRSIHKDERVCGQFIHMIREKIAREWLGISILEGQYASA